MEQKKQQKTIDGYTEKEVSAIIAKEKRYIKRLRQQIQDIRFDIRATYRVINRWGAIKRKFHTSGEKENKT
jgi:hypothetical protein